VIFVLLLLYFDIFPVFFHWYLLVVALLFFFTLGVGFILASLFVLVRDIHQIWSVFTRAWWFATPIFYVISPGGPGSKLSLLNPLYYSIHFSREFLVYGRVPPLWMIGVFACMTLTSLIIGYMVFRILRPKFVDLL
jgi:ABC-type polysaccharide/polyol phosphate export permease